MTVAVANWVGTVKVDPAVDPGVGANILKAAPVAEEAL